MPANFRVRSVPLLFSRADGCWTAIHIELSIPNLVDPRPSDGVLTWRDTVRNGILENCGAEASSVVIKVASDVRGTIALNGVDNHPLRVLRWLQVRG